MRFNLTTNLMVVGKTKTYSEKSKKDYYGVAVLNDSGEAGNLTCTADCYNDITDIFDRYEFSLQFNSQYNFLQAVSAVKL